jgi:hypothetical protein
MALDWSSLREPRPEKLAPARELAHYAVQWTTRAARANLPAVPDDSHSALAWDSPREALVEHTPRGGRKACRLQIERT